MVKNYFLGDEASFSLFSFFLTLPPGVRNISFAGNYNKARFYYFWASFRKESNLEVKGGCGKMIKGNEFEPESKPKPTGYGVSSPTRAHSGTEVNFLPKNTKYQLPIIARSDHCVQPS